MPGGASSSSCNVSNADLHTPHFHGRTCLWSTRLFGGHGALQLTTQGDTCPKHLFRPWIEFYHTASGQIFSIGAAHIPASHKILLRHLLSRECQLPKHSEWIIIVWAFVHMLFAAENEENSSALSRMSNNEVMDHEVGLPEHTNAVESRFVSVVLSDPNKLKEEGEFRRHDMNFVSWLTCSTRAEMRLFMQWYSAVHGEWMC